MKKQFRSDKEHQDDEKEGGDSKPFCDEKVGNQRSGFAHPILNMNLLVEEISEREVFKNRIGKVVIYFPRQEP